MAKAHQGSEFINQLASKMLLSVSVLAVLFACTSVSGREAIKPDLVWVAKNFVGGKQCDATSKYEPPDVKRLLASAGITVYEMRIEFLMVCQACEICPSYAATHYALIERNYISSAQNLGFLPQQPPPAR